MDKLFTLNLELVKSEFTRNEMTEDEKQVLQASRMKGLQKEQAAALARDLQRQLEVQRAFEAVDDGRCTLS